MFCPGCGSSYEEGAKFCPRCGKDLREEQPAAEQANKLEKFTDFGVETNPVIEEPVSEKKSVAAFVLGIVAVMLNSGLGCLCGCLGSLPGMICAISGLILGFKEKSNLAPGSKNVLNTIGIILCFVALGIMVLSIAYNAVLGASMSYGY